MFLTLLIGVCDFVFCHPAPRYFVLIAAVAATALVGLIVVSLFLPRSVSGVRLTDVFQSLPGYSIYRPEDVQRIDFSPSRGEDYDDLALPIRRCEAYIRVRRRIIWLTVSVGDGNRLRAWANRKGIQVVDSMNLLEDHRQNTDVVEEVDS
jgi:hypothetical protein